MKITWKRKILIVSVAIFLLVFAASLSPAFAGEPIIAGDSYLQVLQKKGPPDHYVKSGRDQLLFYGSSIIELMDGEVVRIDGRPAPQPDTAADQAATGQDRDREDHAAPSGPTATQRIIDVRQQGKAIDIRPLLVADGFTVVVFYADW